MQDLALAALNARRVMPDVRLRFDKAMYREPPPSNLFLAGLFSLVLVSCGGMSPKGSQENSSANTQRKTMPIKASRSVEYQGLRIEILALDRFKNWPPRSPSANDKAARRPAIRQGQSGIPPDVEPGSEIAVVRLRTINDDAPGARFDRIVLYDSDGNEYQSTLRSFGIGSRGEKVFPPHGAIEYEFPFIVRKGSNITAVQLRNGEETITFDINWLNVENAVAH